MPLKTLTVASGLSWSFSKTQAGYKDVKQGPEGRAFDANYLPAEVDQALLLQITLAAAGTLTVDLRLFNNLIDEAVVLTGVNLLWVNTTGTITLAPGGANGLTWFWAGSLTIKQHLEWEDPLFTVVDATHKTLLWTNPGAAAVDVFALIGGKTT